MSFDKFASTDGKLPEKPSVSSAPEESDEDLFDFDELAAASSKVATEMKKELDEALTQVEQAKVDVAKSVAPTPVPSAPAAKPAAAPSTATPKPVATAPASVPGAASAAAAPPAMAGATVVHQKLTVSPLAGALLGGVVLANVVLMLFAWSSVNATKQMVLDAAHDMRETSSDLRSESAQRSELTARNSEPVFGALPEGYRTLEIAKERISRGEFARARRMLFGLLAIIDRIDQPARGEVEAQAGFLIADSFRLEGDACGAPTEGLK